MKILGIDYGTKRVGIALSDEGGNLAFPRIVLTNDTHLLKILRILREMRVLQLL